MSEAMTEAALRFGAFVALCALIAFLAWRWSR